MTTTYKSFREHLIECKERGNLIEVDASKYGTFPEKLLVCIEYKSICHSGVCRGERMGEQDDFPPDVGC